MFLRNRVRLVTFVLLLIVAALGFYSKLHSGIVEKWLNNSFTGLLYEVFFCLVGFFFFPKKKPLYIASIVFFFSCILEFFQLWHNLFLEKIRSTFLGHAFIGNSFNWMDFVYYITGCVVGYLIIIQIKVKMAKKN